MSERLRTRTTKLVKGSTKCAVSSYSPLSLSPKTCDVLCSFEFDILPESLRAECLGATEFARRTSPHRRLSAAFRCCYGNCGQHKPWCTQTGTASRSWKGRRPSSRTT